MTRKELEIKVLHGTVVCCETRDQKRGVIGMLRDMGLPLSQSAREALRNPRCIDMDWPYVGFNTVTNVVDAWSEKGVKEMGKKVILAEDALAAPFPKLESVMAFLS